MTRKPSIAERLEAYLDARNGKPFEWPAANCAHFAAEWMREREGWSPMDGTPKTANERAGLRLIAKHGGLAGFWRHIIGRDPLPSPALAQIGDVVILPMEHGDTTGICGGRDSYFVDASGAVQRMPTEMVSAAWRVEGA